MALLPSKPRLYWETLRHLKPVQITGRIKRMLWRPRLDVRPFVGNVRIALRDWTAHAARPQSQFSASRFRFLSADGCIDDLGWDNLATDKLWRYNLHYFDDLAASNAEQRRGWHRQLICRWIAENPYGCGTGWEPYPTSLRIVNWIKAALSGFELGVAAQNHLAVQARWLFHNLEYHLLGNHLMTNVKALLFAGYYFDGPEAALWRAKGTAILIDQLQEQILHDGGHFELSPMYHALALEDLLDVYNLLNTLSVHDASRDTCLAELLLSKIPVMRGWLQAMSHPDGRLAHFNDCAQGIAPPNLALEAYADRLGLGTTNVGFSGVTQLLDSGYVRVDCGGAVAILDVGHVGPHYLPGHAHADTLSFELSIHGERVFVNRGTSVYGTGTDRLDQRGTAAHNTVIVNGFDSSEVWSGFRVARRAKPIDLTFENENPIEISCAHDGYRRLHKGPYHHRRWSFSLGQMSIVDSLIQGCGPAISNFHLHPGCKIIVEPSGCAGKIITERGVPIEWQIHPGPAKKLKSIYNPQFGIAEETSMIACDIVDGYSNITLKWEY